MTGDQQAACSGHPEPLWDAYVDGESERQQAARHARAKAICRRCPIARTCADEVDPRHDDGVRAGRVLPPIHDSNRRSPYAGGFPPERVGRLPEGDPGALAVCDDCGRAMAPTSMRRHWQRFHATARMAA